MLEHSAEKGRAPKKKYNQGQKRRKRKAIVYTKNILQKRDPQERQRA